MSAITQLKKASTAADPIAGVANIVENLTEESAHAEARRLVDDKHYNAFTLGGVLAVMQTKGWFGGHPTLKDYVTLELGMDYRKALYLTTIYERLVNQGIPWEAVKDIGWTKVMILCPVLTADNVAEWVAKATSVNCETLRLVVKEALGSNVTNGKGTTTAEVTTMTFKLHPDQRATIESALAKAKAELPTEYDTVAVENICLGYLSGSSGTVQAPPSLADAMKAAGYSQVLAVFETLWPEVNLQVVE